MRDYYLKADNPEQMNAALRAAGVLCAQNKPRPGCHVSVVGYRYRRIKFTETELEYEQLPGWHVNLRTAHDISLPPEVEQLFPRTPWRTWG